MREQGEEKERETVIEMCCMREEKKITFFKKILKKNKIKKINLNSQPKNHGMNEDM